MICLLLKVTTRILHLNKGSNKQIQMKLILLKIKKLNSKMISNLKMILLVQIQIKLLPSTSLKNTTKKKRMTVKKIGTLICSISKC